MNSLRPTRGQPVGGPPKSAAHPPPRYFKPTEGRLDERGGGRCPICGHRHEPLDDDAAFRADFAVIAVAVIVALAAVAYGLGYGLWLMVTT